VTEQQVLVCDFSKDARVTFALAEVGRRPAQAMTFTCSSRTDFDIALANFLADNGHPKLKGAAVSARRFEENGRLQRLEDGLEITREDLRETLDIQRVNLVNCFVARALAIPKLRRNERINICEGEPGEETVMLVLGPNYGLGNAALLSDGAGGWTALPGEGGHSSLAAKTEREWQVINGLRDLRGGVVRETAMSQQGFRDLWTILHALDDRTAPDLSPAEIVDHARSGDPIAREAISLITVWLADMAADISLIMSATSGIYLAGALMDVIGDTLDAETFATRFTDNPSFSGFLGRIPVWRTVVTDMELIGLATLFD
jgi:glucokinase